MRRCSIMMQFAGPVFKFFDWNRRLEHHCTYCTVVSTITPHHDSTVQISPCEALWHFGAYSVIVDVQAASCCAIVSESCSALNLAYNQLWGTIPHGFSTRFAVKSGTWSYNCITNCTSQAAGCSDRSALVDLYSSTNGTGWLNSTNWLSNASPCTWFGVNCTSGSLPVVYAASLTAST